MIWQFKAKIPFLKKYSFMVHVYFILHQRANTCIELLLPCEKSELSTQNERGSWTKGHNSHKLILSVHHIIESASFICVLNRVQVIW